jgi:nitrite reductase (NO-forming)
VKGVDPESGALADRIARGQATYQGTCSVCHQADGTGLGGVFPPLAKSDYLMADKARCIHIVLAGVSGPIVVNGQTYDSAMPALANFTDHEIADVLTYVRNSFGNRGDAVTDAEVAKARAALREPDRSGHP